MKIRNADTGEWVVQHINYPSPMDIDTFVTDSTGTLMLPEALGFGNYELYEQQSPWGYVLDDELYLCGGWHPGRCHRDQV